MEHKLVMEDATKRSIFRWIHIVFSIPILGYIYSPFEELPKYPTYFEEIGHENGTRIRGIKIQ